MGISKQGELLLLQRQNKSSLSLEVTNPEFAPYCHHVTSETLGIISN